jgi:hypothetical protein
VETESEMKNDDPRKPMDWEDWAYRASGVIAWLVIIVGLIFLALWIYMIWHPGPAAAAV